MLLGSRLWFLLLLGFVRMSVSFEDPPGDLTPAQWFEIQHINMPQACNSAMGHVNKFTKHCKNLNTFLHESFSNVATACQTTNITCKNNHKNCHQSPGPVPLTMCTLTSGKYPNCRYKEKHLNAPYIVACEPPQKGDSEKFQLVPVHLDEVLQVSRLSDSLVGS
uniref:Ribonuclease A-domain domain-containing protein n=1 Tax=Marmota marmota marmota TaxID=9994 RepID=A0A8C5ZNI1_MARMA